MNTKQRWTLTVGARSAWILALPLALGAVFTAASCSSTPPPTSVAASCSINSDCNGKLICAFGKCHDQCMTSKDCTGATCLPSSAGDVCELDQEKTCTDMLPCVFGLTCADDICRAPCMPGSAVGSTGGCLKDQMCVKGTEKGQFICLDSTDGGTGKGDGGGGGTGKGDGGTGRGDGGKGDDGGDGGESDAESDVASDAGECVPPDGGDASALGFMPSNFDPNALQVADGGLPDGGVDWKNPPDVTITGGKTCGSESDCGFPAHAIVSLVDGTEAYLYVMRNFTVQSSSTVVLASAQGGIGTQYPLPVIFAVLEKVEIEGAIDLTGNGQNYAGAGGNPVYGGGSGQGFGGGQNGYTAGIDPYSAPGGGSFCGTGGTGGGSMDGGYPLAQGGTPYGIAKIVPLVGGSAGGYTVSDGYTGPSGGALQISAGTSITLTASASINAGGAAYYGGGGSGGAILLEAPTVTMLGILAANGASGGANNVPSGGSNQIVGMNATASKNPADGGGNTGKGSAGTIINGGNGGAANDAGLNGAGGGGAGWIRINSECPTIGDLAIISPALTTKCATQAKLVY